MVPSGSGALQWKIALQKTHVCRMYMDWFSKLGGFVYCQINLFDGKLLGGHLTKHIIK